MSSYNPNKFDNNISIMKTNKYSYLKDLKEGLLEFKSNNTSKNLETLETVKGNFDEYNESIFLMLSSISKDLYSIVNNEKRNTNKLSKERNDLKNIKSKVNSLENMNDATIPRYYNQASQTRTVNVDNYIKLMVVCGFGYLLYKYNKEAVSYIGPKLRFSLTK